MIDDRLMECLFSSGTAGANELFNIRGQPGTHLLDVHGDFIAGGNQRRVVY